MHGKIKNILKKTALLLTLGITCLTAVSIGKPQKVQAASHIYKNKTFYVYAEHAVLIQSWFSDDKIDQSKQVNKAYDVLVTKRAETEGIEESESINAFVLFLNTSLFSGIASHKALHIFCACITAFSG